ncbi:MAG: MarR family transcriptional regulator [Spirochaetota bacterium]
MKITSQNFIYSLSRIRHLAHTFLTEELKKVSITDIPPSFGDVFVIVTFKGPLSLKDISSYTYKDKSTITLIVKHMEKHGYFKRIVNPQDKRSFLIAPTNKSLALKKSFKTISEKMNKKLFYNLSEQEQQHLFILLEKVMANIK